MSDETQAAAEAADAEPVAPAEDAGAQTDDLDSILDEFKADERPQADPKPTVDEKARLEAIEKHLNQQAVQTAYRDLDMAVDETLRNEDFKKAPRRFVRTELESLISKDPRAGKIFAERHTNPEAYDKLARGVAKRILDEVSDLVSVDDDVTVNRTAARESVRAAARSANLPPDESEQQFNARVAAADPAEFEKIKREMYARNEAARR